MPSMEALTPYHCCNSGHSEFTCDYNEKVSSNMHEMDGTRGSNICRMLGLYKKKGILDSRTAAACCADLLSRSVRRLLIGYNDLDHPSDHPAFLSRPSSAGLDVNILADANPNPTNPGRVGSSPFWSTATASCSSTTLVGCSCPTLPCEEAEIVPDAQQATT
ncbi:hypothetical protein EJB05_34051 [Eragrostis curvula]|uniref:Uncharacterized protein n=1 Tax=Eragrostis curvula TaxID=38414 RepID=A0A5J9U413_9POAL|nr:hypothetical protein EJB05_34051 [Eragrostis curvula]